MALGTCLEMQTLYIKRLGESFDDKALVEDSLLAIGEWTQFASPKEQLTRSFIPSSFPEAQERASGGRSHH